MSPAWITPFLRGFRVSPRTLSRQLPELVYEIADGAVSPLNHVADGSKTLIWLGGERLVSQHGELTQARPLPAAARPAARCASASAVSLGGSSFSTVLSPPPSRVERRGSSDMPVRQHEDATLLSDATREPVERPTPK